MYLVRHGENKANITKEFSYKKVDYPLTEKGVLQARQTGQFLARLEIDGIYTSPLKRASQTAAIIGEAVGLEPVVMENFREINVGHLENLPPSAANWQMYHNVIADWFGGRPERRFPGGEDYFSLWQRVEAGFAQIVAGRQGGNFIIVGHGGSFAVTLKDLCPEADLSILRTVQNHNCSITEVLVEASGTGIHGTLITWGSTGHLSGRAAELVSGLPEFEK